MASQSSSSDLSSSSTSRIRSKMGTSFTAKQVATALVLYATAVSAQSQVSITPPATTARASPLSNVLFPSYAGMGIEPISLLSFTGAETRNELTFNLLSNLANYTGVPPHLRVGGNSGDTLLWNASATGYEVFTNPSPSGTGSTGLSDQYYFGPDFFTAMDHFPVGTPITYGLNLAWQGDGWLDLIQQQAKAALTGVKNVSITGLEIGNEPDLYVTNGYRTSGSWNVNAFASEWQQTAVAIYDNVLKPLNIATDFFEPATTATTATNNGMPYRISNLANSGVALNNGIYIAGWNQHDYYYYVGVSNYQVTAAQLLSLDTTASQLKEWVSQAQQAANTGKPYYLREWNSIGPTGIQGISDTFTQALWTLNAFLYAATQKMDSVQMHMTTFSYNNAWMPVSQNGIEAGVRPAYYAFAAVDQIIGATCNVRIAQQTLSNAPSGYSNNLASYTAYTAGNLQTLVAINTKQLTSGNTGNTVNFAYSVPAWAGRTVYVSLMTASGSDATSGTTWNGLSFEQSGDGTPTNVASAAATSMTVGSDGSLTVSVRDSQAAVINVDSIIGSRNNVVNDTNCGILASSSGESGDAGTAASSAGSGSATALPTFSGGGSGSTGGYDVFNAGLLAAGMPSLVVVLLTGAIVGALTTLA